MDLRTLRIRANLTQLQLAQKAMISQNHYSNIEIGKRKPSSRTAKRITSALGCPDLWYKLLE